MPAFIFAIFSIRLINKGLVFPFKANYPFRNSRHAFLLPTTPSWQGRMCSSPKTFVRLAATMKSLSYSLTLIVTNKFHFIKPLIKFPSMSGSEEQLFSCHILSWAGYASLVVVRLEEIFIMSKNVSLGPSLHQLHEYK